MTSESITDVFASMMNGEHFKRVRHKLGLTQADIALLLGFSSAKAISNIETGFRNPNRHATILIELLDSLPLEEAKNLTRLLEVQGRKYQ